VRQLVNDVIDELLKLASAHECSFPADYSSKVVEKMIASDTQSTMYQDFLARRPMEVETYLGSPVRLAMENSVSLPRIETLYAMLHHANIVNQTKPSESAPPVITSQPPPRTASVPPIQKPMMNGMRGSRTSTNMGMSMPPPHMRRGPPPNGAMLRPPSSAAGPSRMPRDGSSFDETGLEEFSHLVVYDEMPSDGLSNGNMDMPNGGNIPLRERELALRQRELQLREREMNMRRGPGPGPGPGPRSRGPPQPAFDEEDEDDYVDPMDFRPPPGIDLDNLDMMSVTSRRTRKAPSVGQLRRNPEMGGPPSSRPSSSFNRFFGGHPNGRKSTSSRIIQDIPTTHMSLLDDPLMAYSSNRYGTVDRKELHIDSRANSLSNASHMGDFGPGPYPPSRRTSGSPAAFAPNGRPMPRPTTGDHRHAYGPPNGMMPPPRNRPSPPNMRAPVPRYPPGHGNTMAAQQVEQHLGVSNSYPVKNSPNVRSLTGSASASAGSGDSGASANIDSENSAHSSQISLGHPMPMPVR
jgi:Ketopantoate reductase PanE/ApbA C terminal